MRTLLVTICVSALLALTGCEKTIREARGTQQSPHNEQIASRK